MAIQGAHFGMDPTFFQVFGQTQGVHIMWFVVDEINSHATSGCQGHLHHTVLAIMHTQGYWRCVYNGLLIYSKAYFVGNHGWGGTDFKALRREVPAHYLTIQISHSSFMQHSNAIVPGTKFVRGMVVNHSS